MVIFIKQIKLTATERCPFQEICNLAPKQKLVIHQGPVVKSIVSLTSSLMVKMLTVLESTISNSQVIFAENVSSFCKCKSYSHFFSKNISIYAIFNDQSFNSTLTNDIISFEQLGQEFHQ